MSDAPMVLVTPDATRAIEALMAGRWWQYVTGQRRPPIRSDLSVLEWVVRSAAP